MSETAADKMVTVATFPQPAEAMVAQAALDEAGIESVLQGAEANTLIPVAFTSRLLVQASDEAAALGVLEGAVQSPPTEAEVAAAELAAEATPEA